MTGKPGRIGVLGGTFDPVHNGHLALAAAGLREFNLDKVFFVPAGRPPHKLDDPVAPFHHRAIMLELALAACPAFFLDRMEKKRPGPSYSVDTLRELRERLGWDCALYFIIGSDAFANITTWKDFNDLFRYADFLVAERPDTAPGRLDDLLSQQSGFQQDRINNCWRHPLGARVHPLPVDALPISATTTRHRIQAGESIQDLVPAPVNAYIQQNHLYGASR